MNIRGTAMIVTIVFGLANAGIAFFGSDDLLVPVSAAGGLIVAGLWLLVWLGDRRASGGA